jgi:RNA polymerase subunit RPABC4/transcription elongation factor Spt4
MATKKVKFQALEGAVLTDKGLSYKGAILEPIIDKCEGCERVTEVEGQKFCPSYAQPAKKWSGKVCNFATHVRATVDTSGAVKVNPLKASKRAARGR